MISVGKGDLDGIGIAASGEGTHKGELADGHFRGVPIGLGGGAEYDGVVALHPGVAHFVTPFGAGADGDERPEVDEAVIQGVFGPQRQIEPFDLDALAAGGFGEDFDGVALGTRAGDPALIRRGVLDAYAIDTLFDRPDPGTVVENDESPEQTQAGQETCRPGTLRHLRGLSAQHQHI